MKIHFLILIWVLRSENLHTYIPTSNSLSMEKIYNFQFKDVFSQIRCIQRLNNIMTSTICIRYMGHHIFTTGTRRIRYTGILFSKIYLTHCHPIFKTGIKSIKYMGHRVFISCTICIRYVYIPVFITGTICTMNAVIRFQN